MMHLAFAAFPKSPDLGYGDKRGLEMAGGLSVGPFGEVEQLGAVGDVDPAIAVGDARDAFVGVDLHQTALGVAGGRQRDAPVLVFLGHDDRLDIDPRDSHDRLLW